MSGQWKEEGEWKNTAEVILNNLPIGIIFCDTRCMIRFINRAYADYLEIDQNEVIGRPITDFVPDSRLPVVLESGQSELRCNCDIGVEGKRKILIVNRIPVFGADQSIVGVISQSLFGNLGELKELSERIDQLEKKVTSYKEKMLTALSAKYSIEDIKGKSAKISEAKEFLSRYAKTDSPVLLLGATGTGKELFSHALHMESRRRNGPFVSINCAAIPHDLLESELFGYAAGAFTGAQKTGKVGQIELSDKGTLFLDEIGDMPLQAQSKLLRVLEDKILYRLGCTKAKKVDFRLIAATNHDMKKLIQEGKFREDLYFRLNTMTIAVPSLRERKEDIRLLFHHILDRIDRGDVTCSDKAMEALIKYSWPGNVRELKSVIERAVSLCTADTIDIADLPAEISIELASKVSSSCESSLFALQAVNEHKVIGNTLNENAWNYVKTAKMLGISRASLYKKAEKYGISRKNKYSAT